MYNEDLLDRQKHPQHRRVIKYAAVQELFTNSSCGDEIAIFLNYDDYGFITEASWEGYGCAISQVSADLLIDELIGRNLGELIDPSSPDNPDAPNELSFAISWEDCPELQGVKNMPARAKCAGLAWQILPRLLAPPE